MASQSDKPLEILLIEDNPIDVIVIKEAFQDSNVKTTLHTVIDGAEAMKFLKRKGQYAKVPQPHLILLDLNLPKKDGREVLAQIKKDPVLRRIPVIVLTSSKAQEDIRMSYELHANCFITKPSDLDEFIKAIKLLIDFWFNTVTLPGL